MNGVIITVSAADQLTTLNDGDEDRVSEVASFLMSSSVEALQRLCERVAEDEATFARLVAAVRSLTERRDTNADKENFLVRGLRLETRQETDAALDLIYDGFDDLFRRGQIDEADRILSETDATSLSNPLLMGVLTATLPAKSHLPSRAAFYSEAERLLTERGSMEPGLLAGLEQ